MRTHQSGLGDRVFVYHVPIKNINLIVAIMGNNT